MFGIGLNVNYLGISGMGSEHRRTRRLFLSKWKKKEVQKATPPKRGEKNKQDKYKKQTNKLTHKPHTRTQNSINKHVLPSYKSTHLFKSLNVWDTTF